jgi:glycosyltransferase involved in cell wall biosynthesis
LITPVPVLFLEPTLPLGGAERVLFDLVTRLDRDRFRPVVCCLKTPGAIGEALAARGVPVYHDLLSYRYSPAVLPRLVGLLRRERIQVIHTIHQPLNNFWAVLAGRLAGGPVLVSSVHATRSTSHRGRAMLLNRLIGPRLDAVVALAELHRQFLIDEWRIDPAKIRVIPNGIDLARFGCGGRLSRAELGLPTDAPIAGVLAVLRPEKAHDNFLRAATVVRSQLPAAHFALIGDGPERARLEAIARTQRLADRVHFLGRRDDVEQVLPLLDVSVLPSRTEAFPLSVLEAMAASRPVVVTDVGALREIVANGENGLIVPSEDVDALAAAILRVLRDPVLARALGEVGRRRAQEFDVTRMVRSMERLFLEQLAAKTPTQALVEAQDQSPLPAGEG